MNTSVILVWLIVIVGFSALIFFLRSKNKKSKEKKLLPLYNLARENNSEISSYDFWDKTLIGLDNSGVNKLFFIRKVNEKEVSKIIELSDIKNCHLKKTTRAVYFNNENVSVIDKIDLVLTYIEKHKSDEVLEFYNSDYDHLSLSGELQLAEKWSENINGFIGGSQNKDKNVKDIKAFSPLNHLKAKAGVY